MLMNEIEPPRSEEDEYSASDVIIFGAAAYIGIPTWTTAIAALIDRTASGSGELIVSPKVLIPAAIAGGIALAGTLTR